AIIPTLSACHECHTFWTWPQSKPLSTTGQTTMKKMYGNRRNKNMPALNRSPTVASFNFKVILFHNATPLRSKVTLDPRDLSPIVLHHPLPPTGGVISTFCSILLLYFNFILWQSRRLPHHLPVHN